MKFFIFILSIFISFYSQAEEKHGKVCLNMIVKDESRVIERCLSSVKPLIDYWVIVDTGSSDGTQDIIKKFMKDIPGELHERPWKNFGHNRNEALSLAKDKCEYTLFIDADEVFEYEKDYTLPKLEHDFYYFMTSFNGIKYARVQLIKNQLPWKWVGVLHEVVDCPNHKTGIILPGIINFVRTDGFRSTDPQKFQKDAAVLEKALIDEPNNSRYVFYLAQSYRDAGDFVKALENYQKRVAMKGWSEEVFMSLLQSAICKEKLKYPAIEIVNSYYQAYQYRPSRSEPLHYLSQYYRKQKEYAAGYVVAKTALTIPFPKDILFVENWIYDFGNLLELSICAYWIGKYSESQEASQKILALSNLPNEIKDCAQRNLNFAQEKLHVN